MVPKSETPAHLHKSDELFQQAKNNCEVNWDKETASNNISKMLMDSEKTNHEDFLFINSLNKK